MNGIDSKTEAKQIAKLAAFYADKVKTVAYMQRYNYDNKNRRKTIKALTILKRGI